MTAPKAPTGLASRGRKLWREMHEAAEFNPAEREMLLEACRIADRLDQLDALLTGSAEDWVRLAEAKGDPERQMVVVDGALSEARQQANVFKQLVAALRMPDEAGKKPQQRGGARGSYTSKGAGSVSSIERARARASGV